MLYNESMDKFDSDVRYWVALSTHQKIGARTFAKLVQKFGKMEKVWNSHPSDFFDLDIDKSQKEAIFEVIHKIDPDKEMAKVERLKIKVLTIKDKNYPKNLAEIFDPPGVLYYKGELAPTDEISLAVVGSRKYSQYGQEVTEKLIFELASAGLVIVSGLALGIDALAHRACLEAKQKTIAVLGCGLDQIYPVSNIRLADKILQSGGAIISEFPVGMPALRYNFPIRNRIIAGMSLGTLVIEAAPDSGSLITAKAALDYNREVFAVPGSIFSDTSIGPNTLIQMGAKLVTNSADLLTELDISNRIKKQVANLIIADSQEEQVVLELLGKPKSVDALVKESKLPAALINSTLIMLELKGKARHIGGTVYEIRGKLKK